MTTLIINRRTYTGSTYKVLCLQLEDRIFVTVILRSHPSATLVGVSHQQLVESTTVSRIIVSRVRINHSTEDRQLRSSNRQYIGTRESIF